MLHLGVDDSKRERKRRRAEERVGTREEGRVGRNSCSHGREFGSNPAVQGA